MISTRFENSLRIFTWHVHSSYLFYLSQGNFTIYIPINDQKDDGYYGRGETYPFGKNVIEVPASHVTEMSFDCILFQTEKNYMVDQYDILSAEQRMLPRIYLEHDPPLEHPCDETHIVDDPNVVMVHVTHFNRMMWRNNSRIVKVIEHGVNKQSVKYTGELRKGIVVINHLYQRGRKLGWDIFKEVSRHVPLDLIGVGTKEHGGLGEVLHPSLPSFICKYRFIFNPIRYASMGLAVCEAMMLGMPVVALATTEYPSVLHDGESGIIHNDVDHLVYNMKKMLDDISFATAIGRAGQEVAEKKFSMKRFLQDWEEIFHAIVNQKVSF